MRLLLLLQMLLMLSLMLLLPLLILLLSRQGLMTYCQRRNQRRQSRAVARSMEQPRAQASRTRASSALQQSLSLIHI